MQRETFNRMVAELTAMYDKRLGPVAREAYWSALQHLEDREFIRAARTAMRTERFWPLPGVLIDFARGGHEERGLRAQAIVEASVARHGSYASVTFEDRAITAAIRDLGGWVALCMTNEDEWRRFRSRQFRELYHFHSLRGVPDHVAGHLVGIEEREVGPGWDGEIRKIGGHKPRELDDGR